MGKFETKSNYLAWDLRTTIITYYGENVFHPVNVVLT